MSVSTEASRIARGAPVCGIEEREHRELGRQALLPVVDEIADDLDAGDAERRDDAAQHVEMAFGGALRHEVHARLEHRLPQPLRAQPAFDRGQDLVVGQRQRGDVGAVEVGEVDGGHAGPVVARQCRRRSSENGKWQRTRRSPSSGRSNGGSVVHRGCATGQRVWKRQPPGGFTALGISPCSTIGCTRLLRVDGRVRRQQRGGIGVGGRGEELARRGFLDDLAEVHHRGAPGDAADHVEVVADEQVGEAELALQVEQQVEELALHRHVEPGGRLVGDDDLGAHQQRAGDADAARLSAGDLVRKFREHVRPRGRGACRIAASSRQRFGARQRVDGDRLFQRAADGHPRRQRRDGILQQQLRAPPEGERRLRELLAPPAGRRPSPCPTTAA